MMNTILEEDDADVFVPYFGPPPQPMTELEGLRMEVLNACAAMDSDIDERKQAKKDLKQKDAALKQQTELVERMSSTINELQTELSNTQACVSEHLNTIQILRVKKEEVEEDLLNKYATLNEMEKKVMKLEDEARTEAMTRTIDELNQAKKDLLQKDTALKEQTEAFSASIEELNMETVNLKTALTATIDERNQAKDDLLKKDAALKEQIEAMSATIEELNTENINIKAALSATINEGNQVIEDLVRKRKDAALQEQTGALSATIEELNTENVNIKVALSATINEGNQVIKNLVRKGKDAALKQQTKGLPATVKELHVEIDNIKAALITTIDERDKAKEDLLKKDAALKEVQERRKKERASFSTLSEENEALKLENVKLSEDYANLMGHTNHRQKIHHVVNLKKKNQDLKEKKDKLRAQLTKHMSENTPQQKTLGKSGVVAPRLFDVFSPCEEDDIPGSWGFRGANSKEEPVPTPAAVRVLSGKNTTQ